MLYSLVCSQTFLHLLRSIKIKCLLETELPEARLQCGWLTNLIIAKERRVAASNLQRVWVTAPGCRCNLHENDKIIALFTPHDSGLELPKILMLVPEFHKLHLGWEAAILGRPMTRALAHCLCPSAPSSWSCKITRSQGNYKITNELLSCYIVCLWMNSLLLWDFVGLYCVLLWKRSQWVLTDGGARSRHKAHSSSEMHTQPVESQPYSEFHWMHMHYGKNIGLHNATWHNNIFTVIILFSWSWETKMIIES